MIEEIHVEEQDDYMEQMLARLAASVETHGHNRVDKAIDPGLAYWIGRQRIYRNAGHLREYRLRRLDEAGFPWLHVDPGWEEKYARLQAYRERFGHTRVARKWKEDPSLGRWVEHQRLRCRRGEIEPDQSQRLEALGFEWECAEARVEEHDRNLERMLARLRAYRERHGHAGVTRARDFALWQWIQRQRYYLASGCLKPSRRRAMDEVGFPW
ncbi:MAG: helicase associated domain-containing protein, partial [Verrucomicrobiae bacterium]|nr:helicase associated domain-containing protein [Verrucomicrobiae bacterium]